MPSQQKMLTFPFQLLHCLICLLTPTVLLAADISADIAKDLQTRLAAQNQLFKAQWNDDMRLSPESAASYGIIAMTIYSAIIPCRKCETKRERREISRKAGEEPTLLLSEQIESTFLCYELTIKI